MAGEVEKQGREKPKRLLQGKKERLCLRMLN
jgi:hypothetical protein